MMTEGSDAIAKPRIVFLDNLRTAMIFLVVLFHCGLVYESSGFSGFFWIVYDFSTNNLTSLPNLMVIDIFIMPVVFFVSGFFTPASIQKESGRAFLASRFKRLMIPWIVAVVLFMPLYKIIFLYSRNLPQQHWTTYFHWNNGLFSQGWLWFLPVLFLFDILYLLLLKIKIHRPEITFAGTIITIFIVGFIYSVCMDLFNARGWTKTILIDFQNERVLIYFMMFLLGARCYTQRIFESGWKNKNHILLILCTVWIPIVLYRFFFIHLVLKPSPYIISKMVDIALFWLTYHWSLFGLLFVLVNGFRYFLDKQNNWSKVLNANSYAVYILHVVILGCLALAMLNMEIPSLMKFFILVVSTYAISNLFVFLYRRVVKSYVMGLE